MYTTLTILGVFVGIAYVYHKIRIELEKSSFAFSARMRAKRLSVLFNDGKCSPRIPQQRSIPENLIEGFRPHIGHLNYDKPFDQTQAWETITYIRQYLEGRAKLVERERDNRDILYNKLLSLGLIIPIRSPSDPEHESDDEKLVEFMNTHFSPTSQASQSFIRAAHYLGLKTETGGAITSYEDFDKLYNQYFDRDKIRIIRTLYDNAVNKRVIITNQILDVFFVRARLQVVSDILKNALLRMSADEDDQIFFRRYLKYKANYGFTQDKNVLEHLDDKGDYILTEDNTVSLQTLHLFRLALAEQLNDALVAQRYEYPARNYKMLTEFYYDLIDCLCSLNPHYKFAYDSFGDDPISEFTPDTASELKLYCADGNKSWRLGHAIFNGVKCTSDGIEHTEFRGTTDMDAIKFHISKMNKPERIALSVFALSSLKYIYETIVHSMTDYSRALENLHFVMHKGSRANLIFAALFEDTLYDAWYQETVESISIKQQFAWSILKPSYGQPLHYISPLFEQLCSEEADRGLTNYFVKALKPYPNACELLIKCFARYSYEQLRNKRLIGYDDAKLCEHDDFVKILLEHFDRFKHLYNSDLYSDYMNLGITQIRTTLNVMARHSDGHMTECTMRTLDSLFYYQHMREPVIRAVMNPFDAIDDYIKL